MGNSSTKYIDQLEIKPILNNKESQSYLTQLSKTIDQNNTKSYLQNYAKFVMILDILQYYPETNIKYLEQNFNKFYDDVHQFNMNHILKYTTKKENTNWESILEKDLFREAINTWVLNLYQTNSIIKPKIIKKVTYSYLLTMYNFTKKGKIIFDDVWHHIWKDICSDNNIVI
jgi:hypothetical protein